MPPESRRPNIARLLSAASALHADLAAGSPGSPESCSIGTVADCSRIVRPSARSSAGEPCRQPDRRWLRSSSLRLTVDDRPGSRRYRRRATHRLAAQRRLDQPEICGSRSPDRRVFSCLSIPADTIRTKTCPSPDSTSSVTTSCPARTMKSRAGEPTEHSFQARERNVVRFTAVRVVGSTGDRRCWRHGAAQPI